MSAAGPRASAAWPYEALRTSASLGPDGTETGSPPVVASTEDLSTLRRRLVAATARHRRQDAERRHYHDDTRLGDQASQPDLLSAGQATGPGGIALARGLAVLRLVGPVPGVLPCVAERPHQFWQLAAAAQEQDDHQHDHHFPPLYSSDHLARVTGPVQSPIRASS